MCDSDVAGVSQLVSCDVTVLLLFAVVLQSPQARNGGHEGCAWCTGWCDPCDRATGLRGAAGGDATSGRLQRSNRGHCAQTRAGGDARHDLQVRAA